MVITPMALPPYIKKRILVHFEFVCTKLRYVATKEWGTKRYLNMKHLYEHEKMQEYEKEIKRAKMDVA